jgi:arginine decarboxylase
MWRFEVNGFFRENAVIGRVPNKIFLTRGVGRHKEKLTSFELALRDARIAPLNIVQVSSIFPPHCVLIPRNRGISMLSDGEIVHCVLSKNSTNETNRLIGSAIGVAIPKDRSRYGYISEHHDFGVKQKQLGDYTEDLAASMLASTLGIEIDLTRAWDERKQEWKIAGQIVRTTNITQTAFGKKDMWTSVVAAAVFCSYKENK